ncbi:MAG TPA: universal stress protein [Candidatus Bathyarchaeota archaeon]|nr:universal stress protein [Candidatus Bathyarchaeota archaeon]HEX69176.1 universal stress protein [Candidatus Bathyarchaeota archaeon]
MFSKILYPTDFSETSKKAVKYLRKLRKAGTKEVIVLYVIDEHELSMMVEGCGWLGRDPAECLEELERRQREIAEKELKKIKEELETVGINVKTLIGKGTPYKKIIEIAEKENVTLIVMGSHGKGVLKELLIGSVSENVIRHTKKPVLIVR